MEKETELLKRELSEDFIKRKVREILDNLSMEYDRETAIDLIIKVARKEY